MTPSTLIRVACLTILLIAPSVLAFSRGDLVVSGWDMGPDPADFSRNTVGLRVFDSGGVFRNDLLTAPLSANGEATFAPNGDVAATINGDVRFVRSDGTVDRVVSIPSGRQAVWLAFRPSGGLFVGSGYSGLIFEFAPDGALLRTFTIPNPSGASLQGIDLASDQCTLFYVSFSTIGALDVCEGTTLSPVTSSLPFGGVGGLRILPDGTLITSANGHVLRYDRSGHLLRAYTTAGSLMALDVNPQFAWVQIGNSTLQRLDLSSDSYSGAPIVTGFNFGVAGVAVAGEPRAALSATGVPALAPATLGILFLVVLSLGVRLVRQS